MSRHAHAYAYMYISAWRTSYAIWAQGSDFPTLSLFFSPAHPHRAEMYGVWFHGGTLSGGMAYQRPRVARSARLVIVRAATLGALADS